MSKFYFKNKFIIDVAIVGIFSMSSFLASIFIFAHYYELGKYLSGS